MYNKTDNALYIRKVIDLHVIEPPYVVQTFERLVIYGDAEGYNKLSNTKFTIDNISPTGVVTIRFSAALKEPLKEDDLPPFSETPYDLFNVKFIQNYDGYFEGQAFNF